jgi:UDP-N-acetylmuramyl pentapeptide phosphotransferase/UDP-N-acetylglucosamine-1-phosphate transferase
MDVNMSLQYLLALGFITFAFTGLITYPIRKLAIHLRVMDFPNAFHKYHAYPVPYLGGISIALGISVSIIGAICFGAEALRFSDQRQLSDLAFSILIPASLLGVMGLVDDLRSLSPWPRLITQTVVGTVVAFVIVENGTIGTPFGNSGAGDSGSWINTAVTIRLMEALVPAAVEIEMLLQLMNQVVEAL